ncbi:MAG: hypothetical protein PVG30_08770 [Gammaproteobacteria bacterium]|jgi:hypothetical protein
MNTTINTKIDTSMTNEENMDMYFELAIKALIKNHFKSAMKYFKQSISHGSKRAYIYHNFLRCYEDIMLARDIILCAEKRI